MNGKKPRKLRKQAYQDFSQRTPSYNIITRAVRKLFKDTKTGKESYHTVKMGQIVCEGLRAEYLKLKKASKEKVYIPISEKVKQALKKERRSSKLQKERAEAKKKLDKKEKKQKFSFSEVEA